MSFVSEPGEGMVLVPGMTFTIEPMVNAGAPDIDSERPERLDRAHCRRQRHGPMGSSGFNHRNWI